MTTPSLSESSRFDAKPVKRRNFLSLAAIGSFVGAWAVALIGALRLPIPSVYPEASPRFRIGRPDLYPVGSATRIPGRNVWVFRDEKGFYVISAVCTHLGCIVDRSEGQFICPCHGTLFDAQGTLVSGPAPGPLPWLRIKSHASGSLEIDTEDKVLPGSRHEV